MNVVPDLYPEGKFAAHNGLFFVLSETNQLQKLPLKEKRELKKAAKITDIVQAHFLSKELITLNTNQCSKK